MPLQSDSIDCIPSPLSSRMQYTMSVHVDVSKPLQLLGEGLELRLHVYAVL